MVSGGISYEARTDLVVFDRGSVNAQRYVDEVLQERVIPFEPFIGDYFRLRCHTARLVTEYLYETGIQVLPS
jgi:hypothetical protein